MRATRTFTILVTATFAGLPLSVGAADSQIASPFVIEYEEIKRRVDTVALSSMSVDETLGDFERVRTIFVPLIRQALADAGFEVVPEKTSDELFDDLAGRAGGLFNILTGRLDHEKAAMVRDHWARELSDQHGVDAMVHPAAIVVAAKFGTDNKVEACGRTMSLRPPDESGFGKALEDAFIGSTHGVAHVVCIALMIDDVSGVRIYQQAGAVEPTSTIDRAKMSDKEVDELFKSDVDNRAAVNVAVKPLETGSVWSDPGSAD